MGYSVNLSVESFQEYLRELGLIHKYEYVGGVDYDDKKKYINIHLKYDE